MSTAAAAEIAMTAARRVSREFFDKTMTKGPPPSFFDPNQIVVDEALTQLKLKVKEPTKFFKNGASIIDGYIRRTGLKWSTADAITWKRNAPYVKNGQFQWCGAFAAHCYAAAGLKEHIRDKFFSSASRLFDKGPEENGIWVGSECPETGTPCRIVSPDSVKPGDLLVMGFVRDNKPAPSHIGICYKVFPGELITIEGNARGYSYGWDLRMKENEATYEGVIMQRRKLRPENGDYGILRVIRPIKEDYEG